MLSHPYLFSFARCSLFLGLRKEALAERQFLQEFITFIIAFYTFESSEISLEYQSLSFHSLLTLDQRLLQPLPFIFSLGLALELVYKEKV